MPPFMVYTRLRGNPVQNQRERWMELCEQAADEVNLTKLKALITQISALLEAKERRLAAHVASTPEADREAETKRTLDDYAKTVGS
jgi:hypothetical protein